MLPILDRFNSAVVTMKGLLKYGVAISKILSISKQLDKSAVKSIFRCPPGQQRFITVNSVRWSGAQDALVVCKRPAFWN